MLFAVLAGALAARAEIQIRESIFIEAEAFADLGGWVNDTQFMDQMGSPFLLAHGMGKPVADAKTTFVAAGGKYNVWVRTRNWTCHWHPDIGAGTFNLIVNGEKLPNLLGCQNPPGTVPAKQHAPQFFLFRISHSTLPLVCPFHHAAVRAGSLQSNLPGDRPRQICT